MKTEYLSAMLAIQIATYGVIFAIIRDLFGPQFRTVILTSLLAFGAMMLVNWYFAIRHPDNRETSNALISTSLLNSLIAASALFSIMIGDSDAIALKIVTAIVTAAISIVASAFGAYYISDKACGKKFKIDLALTESAVIIVGIGTFVLISSHFGLIIFGTGVVLIFLAGPIMAKC